MTGRRREPQRGVTTLKSTGVGGFTKSGSWDRFHSIPADARNLRWRRGCMSLSIECSAVGRPRGENCEDCPELACRSAVQARWGEGPSDSARLQPPCR